MRRLAIMFGTLVVALGLLGVVAPNILLTIGRQSITPVGIWVVTALRILVGIILVLGAARARSPLVLRLLGILVLIGGIATPLIGAKLGRAFVDWCASHGDGVLRLWSCVALALGLLIAWAATSKASTTASAPR